MSPVASRDAIVLAVAAALCVIPPNSRVACLIKTCPLVALSSNVSIKVVISSTSCSTPSPLFGLKIASSKLSVTPPVVDIIYYTDIIMSAVFIDYNLASCAE